MKVIVDLCVVPIGVGVHLAPYIAACEKVLTEAGLKEARRSKAIKPTLCRVLA